MHTLVFCRALHADAIALVLARDGLSAGVKPQTLGPNF